MAQSEIGIQVYRIISHLLAIVVLMFLWSTIAEAQTRRPVLPDIILEQSGPVVVTDVVWLDQPRPEFPQAAKDEGLTGSIVTLTCIATVEGRATDCEVSETEQGFGFGEAAIVALRAARLQPRTIDGIPIESTFRFRVRFVLEEPQPASDATGSNIIMSLAGLGSLIAILFFAKARSKTSSMSEHSALG